jgi:hypothetical protein
MSDSLEIRETVAPAPAVPIPGPELEVAKIAPFMIVRLTAVEVPEVECPLPIPEPEDELLAVIFPLMTERFRTALGYPRACQYPRHEPSGGEIGGPELGGACNCDPMSMA